MAIIFLWDIPEIAKAYNNNILAFKTDKPGFSYCHVVVNLAAPKGKDIPTCQLIITPDRFGIFRVNFKGIVTVLLNANEFKDEYAYELIKDQYVYDESLWAQVSVSLYIKTNDGDLLDSIEDKRYFFIKASDTQYAYNKGLIIKDSSQSEYFLLPIVEMSYKNKIDNKFAYSYETIDYFYGYPAELPVVTSGDKTYLSDDFEKEFHVIDFHNGSTGEAYSKTVYGGVSRFLIYKGSSSSVDQSDIGAMLMPGINNISMGEGYHYLNINMISVEDCEGVYLKWASKLGGWSYYFFKSYEETRSLKSLGRFTKSFGAIGDLDLQSEMGMDTYDTMIIKSGQLEDYQKRHVETIFDSPKVYIYLRGQGRYLRANTEQWQSCLVGDKKLNLTNSKSRRYSVKLTLIKPKTDNLTL